MKTKNLPDSHRIRQNVQVLQPHSFDLKGDIPVVQKALGDIQHHMDIMMPNMNGYEATAAIRSLGGRPDGKTIPIIAMTANAFAEDVQASFDAGMNAHLSKPIVIDEVLKTIGQNLNR